jgi:hypothetical protein
VIAGSHVPLNLIIATGGGKKRKYACAGYLNRGMCKNNLYISRDELEATLLEKLKNDLLSPQALAYAIEEFGKRLRSDLASLSGDIAKMRLRKEKLEGEIRNLTKAIAESGHSKFILDEIAVREREIGTITDRLLSSSPESIEGKIAQIRNYIERKIQNLTTLFNAHSPGAKQLLQQHLKAVTMHPVKDNKRGCTDENAPREEPLAQDSNEGRLRMVAGVGFEPTTFGL